MEATDDGARPPPEAPSTSGVKQKRAEIKDKLKKHEMFKLESHSMRQMMMHSLALRSGQDRRETQNLNPIWMEFPVKCTKEITSTEQMRGLLDTHTHSDEVIVVRYHQNNCTACNALEKTFDYMCYEARRHYPKLNFYEINKDDHPELVKGMVRFPQVKAFAAGQWNDIDFKPPADFRDKLYRDVEVEVERLTRSGQPVTALQAEEMYFSAAGPSMLLVFEDSLVSFYAKAQARLHNYFKQVSVRRSWFFKKYLKPEADPEALEALQTVPIFGEKIEYGPQLPPSDF